MNGKNGGFDVDAAVAQNPNKVSQTAVQAALEANAKEDADRAKMEAQRRLREADNNVVNAVGNLREIRQQERQHTTYVKLLAAARTKYTQTGDWSVYRKESQAAYHTAFSGNDND